MVVGVVILLNSIFSLVSLSLDPEDDEERIVLLRFQDQVVWAILAMLWCVINAVVVWASMSGRLVEPWEKILERSEGNQLQTKKHEVVAWGDNRNMHGVMIQ